MGGTEMERKEKELMWVFTRKNKKESEGSFRCTKKVGEKKAMSWERTNTQSMLKGNEP